METGALVNERQWLERLRRAPSPLIARQLAAAGIRAADFELQDLSRLPSVAPGDLRLERGADGLARQRLADAQAPIRLGTCERAGAAIVVTFTTADLERAAVYGARAFAAAGIERGMKVANTLEGGLETPGSLIVGDALERLGALDVPLGPVRDAASAAAMAQLVRRIGIDVLITSDASGSALLAALAAAPPPSWRGTIWLGPERSPAIVDRWRRRWISLPEISVFLAVECALGALHLDPAVHVELRDGELEWSALGGDAPLLAYRPGLALRIAQQECRCADPRLVVDIADPI
jgi:hypothetical protein